MRNEWKDDDILTFLRGTMRDDEARRLEAAIGESPELRQRVERLADRDAGVDRLVAQAFEDILTAPVPQRLASLLAADQATGRRGHVHTFKPRITAMSQMDWRAPLAAGFALVFGGIVGAYVADTPSAAVLADFGPALEQTASGETYSGPNGVGVKPLLTFRASDGRYCREFEVHQPEFAAVAISCKANDSWRLEGLLRADRQNIKASTGYAIASGFDEAAIAAIIANLGGGSALASAEEAAAQAAGWR